MVESEFPISCLPSGKEGLRYSPTLGYIIKVASGGCNLRCLYCFYSGHQSDIKLMTQDTARTIMRRAIHSSPRGVTFVWHGGEPLLEGIDFYENVVGIQSELKQDGQVIRNDVQTNGVLINEEWIDFFKRNNWGVGISVDGPEHLHNLNRVDAAGNGTFQRVQRSIDLLRERGLKVGAIAVINKRTLGHAREIFDFMYENGLSFTANACSAKPSDPEAVRNLAVSHLEYANFLLELLDLWLEKDDPQFRITPLEDIVKFGLGGRPLFCQYRGVCERYITIDYNGNVYPCDEFLEDKYLLGNLVDQDTKDIYRNEAFSDYYSGRGRVENLCKDCRWFGVCKGGCMREWDGRKTIDDPQNEEYCLARRILFEGVERRLAAKLKEGGEKDVVVDRSS